MGDQTLSNKIGKLETHSAFGLIHESLKLEPYLFP